MGKEGAHLSVVVHDQDGGSVAVGQGLRREQAGQRVEDIKNPAGGEGLLDVADGARLESADDFLAADVGGEHHCVDIRVAGVDAAYQAQAVGGADIHVYTGHRGWVGGDQADGGGARVLDPTHGKTLGLEDALEHLGPQGCVVDDHHPKVLAAC